MIPDKLNSEIPVTHIEIQNETKTTESKKSDNKTVTSVNIREIPKLENAEKHQKNAEIINVINVDTAISKVQEHGIKTAVTNIYKMEKGNTDFRKMFQVNRGNDKRPIYQKDYWVQFNIAGSIPEGSSPMSYDSSRNSFVAIVFSITLVMLILTAGIVGSIYSSDDLRDYVLINGMLFMILGMGGMLCINYALMCSTCARVLPCNVIILVLAVFFMSMIAAFVTARYRTDIIILALLATAITVLVCLGLAFTSFDFTQFLLYVIAISVAFGALVLIVGIVSLTTGVRYEALHLIILVVGTILNVIFLIMQLQMILGGRAVEISEDDWALAAFMLYSSIVDIFLKLVQLLGVIMMEE